MDVQTWINTLIMLGTAVAAAAAGVALHISRRSARAAEEQTKIARQAERAAARAAKAAEEQTEIQRQIRIDSAQPYVWADLQLDDAQGSLIRLVVGNSGPTIATNIRVEIDPPLESTLDGSRGLAAATAGLAAGLKSLSPGRKHAWPLGMGWDLIKDDGPVYTFTVSADGPFGPVPVLAYVVDVSQWRETADMPAGSLHLLTQSVNKLTKEIVAVQNKQIVAARASDRPARPRQRADEIVAEPPGRTEPRDVHTSDVPSLDPGIVEA